MIALLMTQSEYLLRIIIASVCGAFIGFERESRLKTAGIRTHIIVSLASSLMMIISKYGFNDVISIQGIDLDPSRIAAGVVTAIGFLGTGIIFIRKETVIGLTTAAGIWATVGVGMAVGAGFYFLGIVTAVLILLLQLTLHRRYKWMKAPAIEQISLVLKPDEDVEDLIVKTFNTKKIDIISFKAKKSADGMIELKLFVKFPDLNNLSSIVQLLRDHPNITGIDL